MGRPHKFLMTLARAVEALGLRVRTFDFGILVVPQDTDFGSWTPVGAALLLRIPGGDGKSAELDMRCGVYIPPLEQIIQASDVVWPTTWGSPPMTDFVVERLSVVSHSSLGVAPPGDAAGAIELAAAVAAMVEGAQTRATFQDARDYFATAIHDDWKRFIGLGFAYVLMRHVLFCTRHGLDMAPRDQLMKLIAAAGCEEERRFRAFIDWWDRSPEVRRLAE